MHSPTWNTHGRKLWTSSQWVMFSKCKSIKDAFLRPNDASPVTWKSYLCVYYRPCWSSGCLTLEVCVKSLPSPSLSASVRDPHLPETRRHRWHTHTHTPSCPLSRRFITDVCPLLPSSRRHLLLRAAGGGVKGWSFYNAMRQQMGLSIMRCVCVCVWFCSLLGENPDVFRVRSRGESRDSPRTKIRTQLGEVASPSQGRLIQLKPFNNCAGKLDHSAHVQTPSESLDQLTCSVHSPTLFEVGESASLQISASLKLSDHHSQDSAKLH